MKILFWLILGVAALVLFAPNSGFFGNGNLFQTLTGTEPLIPTDPSDPFSSAS